MTADQERRKLIIQIKQCENWISCALIGRKKPGKILKLARRLIELNEKLRYVH